MHICSCRDLQWASDDYLYIFILYKNQVLSDFMEVAGLRCGIIETFKITAKSSELGLEIGIIICSWQDLIVASFVLLRLEKYFEDVK